jgi:DcuC family C4-dicarboxylate transporter
MLIALGFLVVLVTAYLLIKQYETRMVLFCSGLLMGLLTLQPMAAFNAFSEAMHESRVFEPIIAVMGFSMVMKVTECDKHLIHLLAKALRKAGPFLIPGATVATLAVNISITSAAGCSAAVGSILIPLLISAGVHPAVAASAVFAGTYGAMLNPGFAQVTIVADVAKVTPMAVIANHSSVVMLCGLIGAFSLALVAYARKEHQGWVPEGSKAGHAVTGFKLNLLKAAVPILPLAILILGSTGAVATFKQLGISHAMIIGVFVGFLVTWKNPGTLSKEFWHGAGDAFGHAFGIITCALVFVGGMTAIGLVKTLINAMIATPQIAKISSAFGPFIVGVISGSGDAAAVAFNKAVTVNAGQFGLAPISMGSVAAIAGALGRTMSPVAGGAIICAGLAGVSPLEIPKRNGPGMLIAVVVCMVILLYL